MQDVEELIGLAPEKVLLKWMNFHLKKAGYKKQVTNFSSDLRVRVLEFFIFPSLILLCRCSIYNFENLREHNVEVLTFFQKHITRKTILIGRC